VLGKRSLMPASQTNGHDHSSLAGKHGKVVDDLGSLPGKPGIGVNDWSVSPKLGDPQLSASPQGDMGRRNRSKLAGNPQSVEVHCILLAGKPETVVAIRVDLAEKDAPVGAH